MEEGESLGLVHENMRSEGRWIQPLVVDGDHLCVTGLLILRVICIIKVPQPGKLSMLCSRSLPTVAFAAFCLAMVGMAPAWAAEPITLTLKGHRFVPRDVSAPAGERFRIVVRNEDDTPSEFESYDLRVGKNSHAGRLDLSDRGTAEAWPLHVF